jgi:predicted phosphodiesterase
VARELTRIFSDLHYGDRVSRVRSLAQLRPLLDGVAHLVLNGDTLDTRPSSVPEITAQHRADVRAFFPAHVPRITFLTGNHDADFSPNHSLDLAEGKLFVTHGDILRDDIVPWSQDAPMIRRQIAAALAALPAAERNQLPARFAIWRSVAAAIPQRHQSETRSLRYAAKFARDTVWPPSRVWRILRTWRGEPELAAAFVREHRPAATFVALGHTHRPGAWRTAGGIIVINTGSFCRPLGGCLIDVAHGQVSVRHVVMRGGEFRPGAAFAEFSLAEAGA